MLLATSPSASQKFVQYVAFAVAGFFCALNQLFINWRSLLKPLHKVAECIYEQLFHIYFFRSSSLSLCSEEKCSNEVLSDCNNTPHCVVS